jgi:hypothetical protein
MKKLLLALPVACAFVWTAWSPVGAAGTPPYEVWVTEQSGTDQTDLDGDGNTKDGGFLYVFEGKDAGGIRQNPLKFDLATRFRNGVKRIGGVDTPFAYPVPQRAHIVGFNTENTYAAVSFLGKNVAPVFSPGLDGVAGTADDVRNHDADAGVAFMRVADKKVVAFFNDLNGLHMPAPSPDSSLLGGVSIPQKRVHILTTDYVNESFTLVTGPDGLDLTKLRQDADLFTPANDPGGPLLPDLLFPGAVKPANSTRPFCSNWTPDSRYMFVTFERGGFAILQVKDVDVETGAVTIFNPPILKEVYPEVEVPGEGCGLLQHYDGVRLYTNGATKLFDQEYVYVWDMSTMGNGLSDDLITKVPLDPSGRGDGHGPMFTTQGKFLWIAMRLDSEIKVIDTDLNQVVNTLSVTKGECGEGGDGDGEDDNADADTDDCLTNLTPDVLDTNPQETLMFVTLRGYCPLTALANFVDEDAHRVCPTPAVADPVTGQLKVETDGRRPGVAVFKINRTDGTRGKLQKVYRFANEQPDANPANGGVLDVVDPHGVRVVSRGILR